MNEVLVIVGRLSESFYTQLQTFYINAFVALPLGMIIAFVR